jgi:predicted HTH domain antitoxin
MTLTLESPALDTLGLTPSDGLRDLAIGLFVEGRVTLGRASEIAGMSQTEFMRILGERSIPMHYDESDFEADLALVAERRADRQ